MSWVNFLFLCDCSVGSFNSNVCKGKEWKHVLKEWLNLLKLMHNLKHSYQNQFLKEVLQNRLVQVSHLYDASY